MLQHSLHLSSFQADEQSSDDESDTTETSADGYGEPPPTEDEPEVPAELQALRQRLLYLKNVFDSNLGRQMDDQQKLEVGFVRSELCTSADICSFLAHN